MLYNDTLDKAKAGDLDSINSKHYIQYFGTIRKIKTLSMKIPPDLTWKSGHQPNQWFFGPTGTGKSYRARQENPGFYLKMNNKWFENYEDEDVILIEDVGKSHDWMGDFLKIWADRYGFRAEVKQCSVVLRPQKIVVTSNYDPRDLWPDPCIHEPLMRRFKLINLLELKKFDDEEVRKKKRKVVDEPEPIQRGANFLRQNAHGDLVPWIDDQTVLDDFAVVVDKNMDVEK